MKASMHAAVWLLMAVVITALGVSAQAQESPRKRNVLFIAVDDLRPSFGAYGGPIQTPHIDKLAARGTTFLRAYCQQAVCSPSRTSLLTGRRPDTTRVYELQTHFRKNLPDVVTLPQYFKQQGYHTQSFSKIYHGGLNDPQSWSVPHWTPQGGEYQNPETLAAMQKERERLQAGGKAQTQRVVEKDPKTGLPLKIAPPSNRARGPAWESFDAPDSAYPDGKTADRAIEVLREVKDKPFFLAVGFVKPHLPFVAPKRYYDLYPAESIKLPPNRFAPKGAPALALTNFGELRAYSDIPKQDASLSAEKARELIRGYYAASSFMDAQVGRVLDELEKLGLAGNTVVVLWGDHGWQLGEHDLWCKHTNFEVATRSPLIVSAPGQKNPGAKTPALAEFVDIYPTLCELAGLSRPDGLEGTSLAPVMADPGRPWKAAAFSQYPRANKVMGYTMKTDRYRYTEWQDADKKTVAAELYDHQTDPGENVNVADLPAHKDLVAELSRQLRAGWREAVPGGGTRAAAVRR